MSNSEFFKAAHKVARETRVNFATYRMAFSAALKGLYAMEKKANEKSELVVKAEEMANDIMAATEAHKAAYTEDNAKRLLTVCSMARIKMFRMECKAAKDSRALDIIASLDWNSINNERALATRKVANSVNW